MIQVSASYFYQNLVILFNHVLSNRVSLDSFWLHYEENWNEGKLCRKQWKGMSLLSTSLSSFHNWFGCAQQLVHRAAAFTGSTCPPAFADLVSNTSAIHYNKDLTAFSWDSASPRTAQQRGIMYPHEFVDLCFAALRRIFICEVV